MDGCKLVKIVCFRNSVLLNLFWANDNVETWSCNSIAVTVTTKCWRCSVPQEFFFSFLFMQESYQLYGRNTAWVAAAKAGLFHQLLVILCQFWCFIALIILNREISPANHFVVMVVWFVSGLLICEWTNSLSCHPDLLLFTWLAELFAFVRVREVTLND